MTERVKKLNIQLERENSTLRVTTRIFNPFTVKIRFNARIERALFQRRSARQISRRHSVDQPSSIIVQTDEHSMPSYSLAPTIAQTPKTMTSAVESTSSGVQILTPTTFAPEVLPLRGKRRARSVDAPGRQYIAPAELRSTIENLRRTIGMYIYCIAF